jgi:hypothetical protein
VESTGKTSQSQFCICLDAVRKLQVSYEIVPSMFLVVNVYVCVIIKIFFFI